MHPDGHMRVPPRGAEKAGKCTSDKQARPFAGSGKVSAFVTDLLNEYYGLTKKSAIDNTVDSNSVKRSGRVFER